jgi:hypothetical protein
MNLEMSNMDQHLMDPAGTGLLTHALGVLTGPCAFLAVPPPAFPGQTMIEVVHCICQYIIPVSLPNSATDHLQGQMILFMGEISMVHGRATTRAP